MTDTRNESGTRRVIARFSQPAMAHLTKAKLEEEGIPAYIRDAHTIGIQWLYSIALGGIRVEVDARNEERALQILRTDASEELTEEQWSHHPHPDRLCPYCGSEELEISDSPPRSGMQKLLDWLPLAGPGRTMTCLQCGRSWKQ
ncbi:MAG: DUF2007 domain-containing protein [Desulfovibrionales bacterium]